MNIPSLLHHPSVSILYSLKYYRSSFKKVWVQRCWLRIQDFSFSTHNDRRKRTEDLSHLIQTNQKMNADTHGSTLSLWGWGHCSYKQNLSYMNFLKLKNWWVNNVFLKTERKYSTLSHSTGRISSHNIFWQRPVPSCFVQYSSFMMPMPPNLLDIVCYSS